MVAHPPCTYLSYAGTRHWNNPGRAELREQALDFFLKLYNCDIPKVCIENPVGYPNTVFRKPDQIVHPYYFGIEQEVKRTCLWLKGLPKLYHPSPISLQKPKPWGIYQTGKKVGLPYYKMGYIKDAHERSRFWVGIAKAMAKQWG